MKTQLVQSGALSPIECLHYLFNLPISVKIAGINSKMLLDQAFEAVRSFRPMSEVEVGNLIAKSEEAARIGEYELT